MRTGKARALAAAAALAAFGGLAGCGEKCKTEPVAKVEEAQNCTAAPGAPVSVGVRLCPTCNQTGTTCEVDILEDTIQLDVVSEACEDVTTCATQEPACQVAPLPCSFTAPAEPGPYDIHVYDPQTNTFPTVATLEVVPGAPSSCAFSSVAR
jgi:hypothetical protein